MCILFQVDGFRNGVFQFLLKMTSVQSQLNDNGHQLPVLHIKTKYHRGLIRQLIKNPGHYCIFLDNFRHSGSKHGLMLYMWKIDFQWKAWKVRLHVGCVMEKPDLPHMKDFWLLCIHLYESFWSKIFEQTSQEMMFVGYTLTSRNFRFPWSLFSTYNCYSQHQIQWDRAIRHLFLETKNGDCEDGQVKWSTPWLSIFDLVLSWKLSLT